MILLTRQPRSPSRGGSMPGRLRLPRVAAACLVSLAVAAITAVAATAVTAQDAWPTRPITLTHGFIAGGNSDVVSRIIADALTPRLGQPVIVEPRPGAGGNPASARLAKSDPDGYTLITFTGAHAVSAALYKSLPFDPIEDFQYVSLYGYQ